MRMEHIALAADVCKKGAKKPSIAEYPDSRFSRLAHRTAKFVAPTRIDKQKSSLLLCFFSSKGAKLYIQTPDHRPLAATYYKYSKKAGRPAACPAGRLAGRLAGRPAELK